MIFKIYLTRIIASLRQIAKSRSTISKNKFTLNFYAQ